MGMQFGKTPFAKQPFGVSISAAEAYPVVSDLYTLEVCDEAGLLLCVLPDWISGQWEATVNEPSTLEFYYPYDDVFDRMGYVAPPNVVRLVDRRGVMREAFDICSVSRERDENGVRQYHVQCESMLARLGNGQNTSYDSGTDKAAGVVVADLLSLQADSKRRLIVLGEMDAGLASTTVTYAVENQTILQVLSAVLNSIGGYFWVDAARALHWKYQMAPYKGQELRIEKNLPDLKATTDYSGIRTRVVAYGAGIDEDKRLTVTVDAASEYTDLYGIRAEVVSYEHVSDEAELTTLATVLLAKLTHPSVEYECSAIDLHEMDSSFDYAEDTIYPARRVRLYDPELDVNVDTRIQKVTRDLAAPTKVSIEVGKTKRSALDELLDVVEALRMATTGDTGTWDAIQSTILGLLGITSWDGLVTTDDMSGYVIDYVTTILATYVTNEALGTALEGYVQTGALADYTPTTGLPAIITGALDDAAGGDPEWWARLFKGTDLNDVNDLPNQEGYEDLTFKAGDFALTTGDKRLYVRVGTDWEPVTPLLPDYLALMFVGADLDEVNDIDVNFSDGNFAWTTDDNVLYVHQDSDWIEVLGGGSGTLGFVTAATYAALDTPTAPALGYVTGTDRYYIWDNTASVWRGLSHLDNTYT